MTEINEELNQRIERLSQVLSVEKLKIINASILFGLYKYLLPYQKAENMLSTKDLSKKTDELYEFNIRLKAQIESDYSILQDLGKIEKQFESKYQDRTITTSVE